MYKCENCNFYFINSFKQCICKSYYCEQCTFINEWIDKHPSQGKKLFCCRKCCLDKKHIGHNYDGLSNYRFTLTRNRNFLDIVKEYCKWVLDFF